MRTEEEIKEFLESELENFKYYKKLQFREEYNFKFATDKEKTLTKNIVDLLKVKTDTLKWVLGEELE